jgi:hypothetical protein
MEGHRLQEREHAIVHCRTGQLHEVVDQRITPPTISMQEAARQVEARRRERLTCLPFEDGVGVVEDGVGRIDCMACSRLMGEG